MTNIECWISWRYLVSKRKEKFISLISLISILGIAIGVMALIVVLGVMSGFDQDLKEKIVGSIAPVSIERDMSMLEYNNLLSKVGKIKDVKASSPYLAGQVFLTVKGQIVNLNLRGIDQNKETNVTNIVKYIVKGNLDLKDQGIVIGRELANYLGLGIGDEVVVTAAFSNTPHFLKIKGIFNSGMYDYDLNLVLVDLKQAQSIFSFSGISGVSLKIDNLYKATKVKSELQKQISPIYFVRTWIDVNKNFFAALRLEKITMFIILTLIVLVASFNIISTLIVLVVDKTKDIGILKSLGLTRKSIRKIFTFEGIFIGIMGIILGFGGGILISHLLKKYQFIKLPADIYYLDHLPVTIRIWPDIILVVVCAFLISLISTIYPANKAARFDPAQSLRYE